METQSYFFNQRKRIIFLRLTAPLFLLMMIFSGAAWPDEMLIGEIIEQLGLILILLCIGGRCWASLYIGDKKNAELITQGPYRYTRNPLYFFSALGMLGLGLTFESVTLGITFFCFGYLTFSYVIKKEAKALFQLFGASYESYCQKVPEFFPAFHPLEKDHTMSDRMVFSQKALQKTCADSAFFLLVLPFEEIIEFLHNSGIIQVTFYLY